MSLIASAANAAAAVVAANSTARAVRLRAIAAASRGACPARRASRSAAYTWTPVSTPTPTTTDMKATAIAERPPGRAAAQPAVHTVPRTSGGITASSARTLRNISANTIDASTIESEPLIVRSRSSIFSVAAAIAWPPVRPKVTPGCAARRGSKAAFTSATKARASSPRRACPFGFTSTRHIFPSSVANAPSGWVRTPAPTSAPSNTSCARRSGSCAITSLIAEDPGASSIARVSARRVRMPSGVSASARRSRDRASAWRHASIGSSVCDVSTRSAACSTLGRARRSSASRAAIFAFSSGSSPRIMTTPRSPPPKPRTYRFIAAAFPLSGRSEDTFGSSRRRSVIAMNAAMDSTARAAIARRRGRLCIERDVLLGRGQARNRPCARMLPCP